MAGIYLHIPYCKQACHYCDFHFSTNQQTKSELVDAIARELLLQKNYVNGEVINTIYFGGGTPSLLTGEELQIIFAAIYNHYRVADMPEITLEANPDDLTPVKAQELHQSGVNRLSIGIQSFDDHVLQFLNRAHNAAAAKACVHIAREAGFQNVTIDLIYAIPGLTSEKWLKNLEQALRIDPEHISAYSLTIEEKTVFGRWAAKGKINPVDEEMAASQLEDLINKLEGAGYEHYEVSNFAKNGFYSKHNSSYWTREKYLGVGPSAHSFDGQTRQHNVSQNYEYLRKIKEGEIPCTIENLTIENQINDYLLTALRTVWGCQLDFLKEKFGYDLKVLHKYYIERLVEGKFATLNNNILTLTKKGKMLADKIAFDLFAGDFSKSR